MKALGTGWARGVGFTQIELLAEAAHAAPTLRLTGEARAVSDRLGVVRWHCSVSHDHGMAVATVILEA